MPTGIDVFFNGLMLICIAGQPNCPRVQENIAWVVKADGSSAPCGRTSPEITQLVFKFRENQFSLKTFIEIKCEPESGYSRCIFPAGIREICLKPSPITPTPENQIRPGSLQALPRLDEVDSRFKAVLDSRLGDLAYVPTRIHFPYGVIDAGPKWPPGRTPILWYRSDGSAGGALPRELSDRLKVTYSQASTLKLNTCDDVPLAELVKVEGSDGIVLQNAAIERPLAKSVGEFDDLGYLVWYYPLGSWDASFGTCPNDARLLRCIREGRKDCAYQPFLASDTTFWPPKIR